MKVVFDTTTTSERARLDTLALEQSIVIEKLDSMIVEKRKKVE
jgi:hypothetical protein